MIKKLVAVTFVFSFISVIAAGCGRPSECEDLEAKCLECSTQCETDACLAVSDTDDGTKCEIELIAPCSHPECP